MPSIKRGLNYLTNSLKNLNAFALIIIQSQDITMPASGLLALTSREIFDKLKIIKKNVLWKYENPGKGKFLICVLFL